MTIRLGIYGFILCFATATASVCTKQERYQHQTSCWLVLSCYVTQYRQIRICCDGWTGSIAEGCPLALICHDNPCLNNGTCSGDPVNGYTCNCSIGYTGKDCERANITIILNDIPSNATQSNAYTTKSNTNGTQSNDNVTQTDEQVSETGGTNTALLWGILGAILGFIWLMNIALLIYKVAKRKVRSQKQTDGEQ